MIRTVAVLAGRRIDAQGAVQPRFPLSNIGRVERDIAEALASEEVDRLVCAAACGADLLALHAAHMLKIPALIVLPFDKNRFKRLSVVDRPGDWGALYDMVIGQADARGDLIILDLRGDDDLSFVKANAAMVEQASGIGCGGKLAVAVWDGRPRGNDDATAAMIEKAQKLGFRSREVLTI
ncbi:hypothetical protein [Sphingomonas aurantiaca]|uniref:hypothetical protein n=1 Tax=Sphingomonas aurantiaca TaxID=185949 RepID=UPI003353FA65